MFQLIDLFGYMLSMRISIIIAAQYVHTSIQHCTTYTPYFVFIAENNQLFIDCVWNLKWAERGQYDRYVEKAIDSL